MENNMAKLFELKEMWRTLYQEVKVNRKFKIDTFENAFSQTYMLLKENTAETSLDKQVVKMIAEAYLFANIKDNMLESACLAACVLTERMLSTCAFNSSSEIVQTATVYVLEAHKEIMLDFGDINESISKLAKVYDDIFVKTLRG